MSTIPALSLQHPRITIPLSEHVGDMVSFAADPGGNVPVPLARPAGDNLCRGDSNVALQMTNLSYGFDTNSGYQQIIVTFQSEVAGLVEIAAYYDSIDTTSLPSTPGFGRYTGVDNRQFVPQYNQVDLNGSSGYTLQDYCSGYDIFRGNEQYGRFRWGWFGSNYYGGSPPAQIPVVVGSNTLTIHPYNGIGQGCIFDAIFIRLLRDKSQCEPRGFFPDLSFGINVGGVQAKLGVPGCRAVYMGDSFTVGGAMAPVRDAINQGGYPLAGLGYSLGSNGDTAGEGSTWANTNATAVVGTVSFTASGGANVSGQLDGVPDYQWTQTQTGSVVVTLPIGTAYWQVIYGRSAASAPFTYAIDAGSGTSVSTASSSSVYGAVSGTLTPDGSSHTLTLAKADTSAADGLRLSYVVVAKDATGHIAMRVATSGQAPNDFFPGTNNAAWASLVAAFAPNLWFFENQNWQAGHDSLQSYDYVDFALALEAILPSLCDPSGALFVLTAWWNFNSGAFSWSGSIIPPLMSSARELERQMIDRLMYARLPRQMAVLDFGQYSGWWEQEALLYNAAGYASQTSDSIGSFHGATVGYSMVGGILGRVATGAIALSDSDSPGVTQLLGEMASLALLAPANRPAVNADGTTRADVREIAGQAASAAAPVAFPASVGTSTYGGGAADASAATILSGVNSIEGQTANIGVSSAALNTTATLNSITTGTETSGTYADTFTADQVYDEITPATGATDLYYQFTVGATGIATTIAWVGYLTGATDAIKVYAYNWTGSAWDQIGTIGGVAGTVESNQEFDLTNMHTGTGGNAGLVRIRFAATGMTLGVLYTDRLLAGYTVVQPFPTNFADMAIGGDGTVNATLVATGLDSVAVTAPTGAPTTFTQMVVMLYRRFFKKATNDGSALNTYADDNTTVITSQTLTDDGTVQTQETS